MNAQVKVPAIVAGMTGGADSIDDLDLLRHGAMPGLFGGIDYYNSALRSSLKEWGRVKGGIVPFLPVSSRFPGTPS